VRLGVLEREREFSVEKSAPTSTLFGTLRATLKAINDTQAALTDQNTELLSQLNTSLAAATQNITAILLGSSGEGEEADTGLVGKVDEIGRIVSDEDSGLPMIFKRADAAATSSSNTYSELTTGDNSLAEIKAAIGGKDDQASEDGSLHAKVQKVLETVTNPTVESPSADPTEDILAIKEAVGSESEAEWVTTIHRKLNVIQDSILALRLGTPVAQQPESQMADIMACLPQPGHLSWAEPVVTAFLTAQNRSRAASTTPWELDGEWRGMRYPVGAQIGGGSFLTVRYTSGSITAPTGWLFAKEGSSPYGRTYEVPPPPQAITYEYGTSPIANAICELIENTTILPTSRLHIISQVDHSNSDREHIQIDSLDAVMASDPIAAATAHWHIQFESQLRARIEGTMSGPIQDTDGYSLPAEMMCLQWIPHPTQPSTWPPYLSPLHTTTVD
jgi:hypothetical protein